MGSCQSTHAGRHGHGSCGARRRQGCCAKPVSVSETNLSLPNLGPLPCWRYSTAPGLQRRRGECTNPQRDGALPRQQAGIPTSSERMVRLRIPGTVRRPERMSDAAAACLQEWPYAPGRCRVRVTASCQRSGSRQTAPASRPVAQRREAFPRSGLLHFGRPPVPGERPGDGALQHRAG